MENYLKFKNELVKQNSSDIFERFSIDDSPLFGLNDFSGPDYLDNKYSVKVSDLNKIKREFEYNKNKLEYIYGYLQNLEMKLINYSKILDDDLFFINNSEVQGKNFLNMFEENDLYNNFVEYEIAYRHNLIDNQSNLIKGNTSLKNTKFTINYSSKNAFFISLEEDEIIEQIILDFYKEHTISIFGQKEDGIMKSLFSNVSSNNKVFINQSETKFKSFYITAASDIMTFFKDVQLLKKSTETNKDCSFNVIKKNNLDKLEYIKIISDSDTKIYKLNRENYLDVIDKISTDQKYVLENYCTSEFEIKKNKNITVSEEEVYIMEVLREEQNMTDILKIYGKEK